MKNILSIFLISVLLFGCSKEDDGNNNNITGSIIGVWKAEDFTTIYEEGYINSSGTEVITYTDVSVPDPNTEEYIEFKSNNTFSAYNYENGTLDLEFTSPYTRNGNEIIWILNGKSTTFYWTIMELNNTNLSLTLFSEVFETINDTNTFVRQSGNINLSKSILP